MASANKRTDGNNELESRHWRCEAVRESTAACDGCRQMQSAGVCVHYVVDEVRATGTCCLCFAGGGLKSSVTDIGASKQLVVEHLSTAATRACMQRAVCFYIECYQLGCCFDVLRHVALYALHNDRSPAVTTDRVHACFHHSSHHIEETDAGLDRPLCPRNKMYNKNLKSF